MSKKKNNRAVLAREFVSEVNSTKENPVEDVFNESADEETPEKFMGDDDRYHMLLNFKGYEFDFVPARLKDQRVLYIIGKLQNTNDVAEIMKLQSRFFDIILGENAFDVMDAVAERSGGILDEVCFSEFVSYLMEQSQAKN